MNTENTFKQKGLQKLGKKGKNIWQYNFIAFAINNIVLYNILYKYRQYYYFCLNCLIAHSREKK